MAEFDIFQIAREKVNALIKTLQEMNSISEFELTEKNDLKLILHRKDSSFSAALYIYSGGEVFSRKVNGYYETFQTAYDLEDKVELLDEILHELRFFMENNDYEEWTYSKGGRVVFRELHYPTGEVESCSTVFGGRLRRIGVKPHIQKP